MHRNVPFTGFYSLPMREAMRCLSDRERVLFVTIALYSGPNGTARPGVRELHEATGYHTKLISDLLDELHRRGLVMILRRGERDPLTQQILSDVYAVNPDLVLVSDDRLWHENRVRHNASTPPVAPYIMPESLSSVKTVQAEQNRFRKQNQGSINSEADSTQDGAAPLPNAADVATRSKVTKGEDEGASSSAGSQRQPNSTTQSRTPPGSVPPPSPKLSFTDNLAVEAIRRQVTDMSHEKAVELVALYGVDRFTAAVMAMKARAKKVTIKRPTGWIIGNLQKGVGR